MIKRVVYLLLILFLCYSCFNVNKISLYNLSALYSTTMFTELKVSAFNIDRETVRIHVPIEVTDMIIDQDEENARSYRKFEISYELFETYESKQILDSASFVIVDSSLSIADTNFQFDINYPGHEEYVLKLSLTDLNRIDAVTTYLHFDNRSDNTRNSYLLKDEHGDLMYSTSVSSQNYIGLQVNEDGIDKLIVRYYKREFPLALPPFMEEPNQSFEYKADSVFNVHVTDKTTPFIDLSEEGFYHFQKDSNQREGYTIFRFYDGFPEISTSEQMLMPLRYITSRNEFAELTQAKDSKLSVDNFWLKNAGNPTRARAMIQKFYSRVVDANVFFTSYHEGWKTDRGLVYIVYGPPKIVYRGDGIEEWLYGEKGNSNSIRFQFLKVVNPFTDNDYSLVKSPSFKEKWYNIVNTWRR